MQVTNFTPGTEGLTSSHRKDKRFQEGFLFVEQESLDVKIDVRIYGTQSRNYCCLWVRGAGAWNSGSGYAGGWGYHRPSAAMQNALTAAGITLDEAIDGRGESSMEAAIMAIAKHLGYEGKIIKAHG
jgi:hypothetical protein